MTDQLRIPGGSGILTIDRDLTPDDVRRIRDAFLDARTNRKPVVISGYGAQWHPFKPRKRIRLARVERALIRRGTAA